MTSHYLDCTLITEDQDRGVMMSRVYSCLHGILASQNRNNVGVSFPEIEKLHFGNILRMFSDRSTLAMLAQNEGFQLLERSEVIHLSAIEKTPSKVKHVCFSRFRSSERGKERSIEKAEARFLEHLKKRGIEPDELLLEERRKKWVKEIKQAKPFVRMKSQSNGSYFSFVIDKTEQAQAELGPFNNYGMGKNVTVPWF